MPIFCVTDRGHEDFQKFKEIRDTSVLYKPYTMEFFLEFLRQMDALYYAKNLQREEQPQPERPICRLSSQFDV